MLELAALQRIAKPDHVDVVVDIGQISVDEIFIGEEYKIFSNYKYNGQRCFFELPADGSRMLVEKRNSHVQVTLQVNDPKYQQTLLSYFYGTGLSSILHFNTCFLIHASGVEKDGKLMMFCGRSGIGKSTLAAKLKARGFNLFSDDKCLLLPDGKGAWMAKPGLKIMRLWQDALDTIASKDFLSNPKEVVLKKDKFQFEMNQNNLNSKYQKVAAFYILRNTEEDAFSIRELIGIEKIKKFKNQIFRKKMVKGMGLDKELWVFLTRLLEDVPVYLVMRPTTMTSDGFANSMDRTIKKQLSGSKT